MKTEIICGCIIFDKATHSKVLLVYSKEHNFWGFPKGHIEDGETEAETALREVEEEIGIDVKILNENNSYKTSYILEKDQIHKKNVFFIAEPYDDNVEIKNQEAEIGDSKWVPIDEAFELLTYENTKDVLRRVEKDLLII